MSKAENVDELLGAAPDAPAAKKAAKKAPAKEAKPGKEGKEAKAPAKPAKAPAKAPAKPKAKEAEPAARTRTPIQFAEGERDKLYEKIGKTLPKIDKKKGINSRELAEKLGTETRKLRVCLYTMQGRGEVKLKSGESKVAGMMVHPA